jgi:low affinity Fe/Cu permease
MPSEQRKRKVGRFDKFADLVDGQVSKAWFFAFCVALVVGWAPTLFILKVDTAQLIINTVTTIITFLLIALLQNTSKRGNDAQQAKLNSIIIYILTGDKSELRAALGLEEHEGTAGTRG